MTSNQHQFFTIYKASYVITSLSEYAVLLLCKGSIGLEFINYHVEGINNRNIGRAYPQCL